MLNFPESTAFGKRIPKNSFYKHLSIDRKLETLFIQEIESITWAYKLAPDTINITTGKFVKEIQVIEIKLKMQDISKRLLEFIDREIPYHILFILKYDLVTQFRISYKEESKAIANRFKVDTMYHTDWVSEDQINISIDGLTFDAVYENFIEQISAGDVNLQEADSLKDAVETSKEKKKTEIQIERIKNKINTEKQFNRQLEYKHKLKELQHQLKTLK